MIRYTLRCAADHRFDSWFQSSAAYDGLAAKGLVTCAICGGNDVEKALMAPRVAGAEAEAATADAAPLAAPVPDRPLSQPAHPAEQALRALREHLAKNSTYVGGRFASEARAMHLGEADPRPIHGEATPLEARALLEEGIAIAPLPIVPPDKTN